MAMVVVLDDGQALNLRGLVLVALTIAWLAGIILDALLPLPAWMLLLGAGIALLSIWLLRDDKLAMLVMALLLCSVLGAWRYTIALPGPDPQAISALIGGSQLEVRGEVVDEPKLQGWGSSRLFIVAVSSVSQNGGASWYTAHGQLEVVVRGTAIEDPYGANYGDQVELTGKVQAPAPHSPPEVFASMAFPRVVVNSGGGNPFLAILYHVRASLAILLAQVLPQPEAALLIAILLGLRTPALKPFAQSFNVTGTAHLIVPSGFKVTILAGLVARSIQWLQKILRRKNKQRETDAVALQWWHWQDWLPTLLVLGCIACYTVLSGAGAAAIRAGIMGMLLVIAPRLNRFYNVYTALALTALLMSVLDPFVLWDVGFQLSFLGTLGIVLFTPYMQRWLFPIARLPLGHLFSENIAVTLSAQLATLPIFALTFQNISLVAPLANILTVPLLALLLLLGTFLCLAGLIFAPLAMLCSWIAWPILWYILHIIAWCSQLPAAYFNTSNLNSGLAWCYYALLALAYVWLVHQDARHRRTAGLLLPQPRHTRLSPQVQRIGLVSAALVVIVATTTSMLLVQSDKGAVTVAFLSVGPAAEQQPQGEAILLRTAENKTILIDGGLDAVSLSKELDSRLPPWQRSLDLVVLTSPRRDHIMGLLDILQRYQVGKVIDAGMLHPDTTYALWRRNISERRVTYLPVVQGETIPIGNVSLQILWPLPQLHRGSNEVLDNSLVVRLILPGLRILLLGAAAQSAYALKGLLTELNTNYLQAEIVQTVGEFNKPAPALLETVLQQARPEYLVVTPASLSPQQRKLGQLSQPAIPSVGVKWHTVETAQVGTVEVICSQNTWNIDTT